MVNLAEPSAPPRPVYPKPDTDWKVLLPLETTTQIIYRRIGQLFVGIGFAAIAARFVASRHLTGTPNFIINTCFALSVIAVASLVGGVVFWFFNRLGVSAEALRLERIKIGQEILPSTVAELFTKARTSPVSTFPKEELNEWIRYYLSKYPFETFLQEKTRGIYTLPLDTLDNTTKDFLKYQAIGYFQQPYVQYTLPGLRELPFYQILDAQGKAKLDMLIAHREAAKLPPEVNAAAYVEFIRQQGIEVLGCLPPEQLPRLCKGFVAQAVQSEKGILALGNDHAAEWAVFGEFNKPFLFQTVANREAAIQPYSVFIERNGISAIGMVTDGAVGPKLLQSFIAHVVNQGVGLLATRNRFEKEIGLFGSEASKSINDEILKDEAKSLDNGNINYKQFRARNGFVRNVIYRPFFLALPYADLVSSQHNIDRDCFTVTRADIEETLRNRWQGMSLKEVLATDADGFFASMQGSAPYFFPGDWTDKAVRETQTLSVREVITTYQRLFTAGVLTAQNGGLNDRLLTEIASFTCWKKFFDAYGSFVFQYFSIAQSTKVVELVRGFIIANAESFLKESYDDAIKPYVQAIETYELNFFCKDLLKNKREEKVRAEKVFLAWVSEREKECNKKIQNRQAQAKKAVAKFESSIDLPGKKQKEEKAKKNHARLEASYKDLERDFRKGGERLLQITKLTQEKRIQLSKQEQKLQQLQASAPQFQYQVQAGQAQAGQAQAVKADLQNAEVAFQNYAPLKQLQEELSAARKEAQEVQQKIENIEKLDREWRQLNLIVNDQGFFKEMEQLETLPSKTREVRGLEAAKKAKEEAEKAPKKLQEMKTQIARFKKLQELFATDSYQIGPLKTRLAEVEALIVWKQGDAEAISTAFNIEGKKAAAASSSQAAAHWQQLAAEAQFRSNEIAVLKLEIEALSLEYVAKNCADQVNRKQLPVLATELKSALDEKSATESAHETAVLALSKKKCEIEEGCNQAVKTYNLDKGKLISEEKKNIYKFLQGHLSSLKERLRVA